MRSEFNDLPDIDFATDLVTARFGMSTELVAEYDAASTTALDALANGVYSVPMENLDIDYDSVQAPAIGTPPTPDKVDPYVSTRQVVTFPDMSEFSNFVGLVDLSLESTYIPTFGEESPVVNIPDAPDDLIPDIPSDEPIIADKDVPVPPDYDLPAVPVLEEVDLPEAPQIENLTFSEEAPVEDLTPPSPMFVYSEGEYQSDVADAIKTKLYNDVVNGGTGLDSEVEQAIWDRALSRLNVELSKTYIQITKEWSAWNFDMPDGVLSSALREAHYEADRNRLDLTRDVAFKQADLAQQNTQFAITSGLVHEKQLMDFTNQINTRQFEIARYRVQSVIDIFNMRVSSYNARLEGFKTAAQVFAERIRAELAKVERYRVQMEGAKIRGELQMQKVELYSKRIESLRLLIEMYRAHLDGIKSQVDVDRAKIDLFRERINAAVARINGVTAKYNLYQSQIAGETSKVDLFGKKVDAYGARVAAAKTESDIKYNTLQSLIETNKERLSLLGTALEKYKADTGYEISKDEVGARVHEANVRGYGAEVTRETGYIKSKVDLFREQVNKIATEVQAAIKELDANLRAATALKEMQIEGLKSAALIQAQKVASALSSVSASAQVGFNGSLSNSYAQSISDNWTYGQDYSYSWAHIYNNE